MKLGIVETNKIHLKFQRKILMFNILYSQQVVLDGISPTGIKSSYYLRNRGHTQYYMEKTLQLYPKLYLAESKSCLFLY